MKVSVIVATYRRDKTLKRALESLVNQSYKNIEIIIIDDNDSVEWGIKVEKIVEDLNNEKIIYINEAGNLGSAKARNLGIQKASGSYITFLDDDDIYLSDKIKRQLEAMLLENADFSATNLVLYDEKDRFIERRTRSYIKKTDNNSLFKYHLMHNIAGTNTLMFKNSYLQKIGGFEEIDSGDDFYLMVKAIQANGKFIYVDRADVKAYIHINTEGLSSGEHKIQGENKLFEYKKQFFYKLNNKSKRYIVMRHYAVLAFVEIRRKNIISFFRFLIKSLISSPIGFLKLIFSLRG